MTLRDRILSALTPRGLVEYQDSIRPELPKACEHPDRCAAFWRDVADRAHADADRFASQLMELGVRPAPLLDGNQEGKVAS